MGYATNNGDGYVKPKEFVKEYSIKSLVCCFSGGKDSLVATHYVMNELKDLQIHKEILWVDTTIMLPIVEPFVREVCKKFGWKLTIVYPERTFLEIAKKKGLPRIHRRWCCDPLKMKPMFNYIKGLPPQRGAVTGLRRAESTNRKDYPFVSYFKKSYWLYSPLIEWTRKQVETYIRANNLPNPPQYKFHLKETCMCGAFANQREFEILKACFPDFWNQFVNLEKELKGYACFNFKGKPVYAKDLDKQTLLQDKIEGMET